MRLFLMTILRTITWFIELDGKFWPDHWMARRIRVLFFNAASRLIVGAVVGLGMGCFSAILGIRLSVIDVRDPTTFNQMMGLVVSSAVALAVILACIFDFTHIYLFYIKRMETRLSYKASGKVPKTWDDEIDGLPPKSASTEKSDSPDNADRMK